MTRIFYALLILIILLTSGVQAGNIDYRAPRGLDLPAGVRAVSSENSLWQDAGSGIWSLARGRTGLVEAPAWWSGNRPPRDELVVLEIEYLDNLSLPAMAEIYSGLGSGNYFSELHRFGGLGDGKWKKARVPATADFVFTKLPENTIRFRLSCESGDLRVRSLRLVAPLADEHERYNAETRAWVAQVQQRALIDPSYYERFSQPKVIPREWNSRPLVPFVRDWMDLVMPVSAPQAGEAGAPLRLRMFRNEYESAQLGVFANGQDLEGVRVSAAPLKDKSGRTMAGITLRVAEYSKVKGRLLPDYMIEPFPQRLWPAYPFNVPEGRSQLVWVTLRTLDETSLPGRYSTTVTLEAKGLEPVEIPIELEILPERLLTMEEAELKLGGCTQRFIPEFEMEFLTTYNHNMVNIWYQSERPELTKDGDTFSMGWRIMDEWMAAARRAGMTDMVYFLGGNPYGFPRTMHLPRTLANVMLGLDDEGWRELSFRDPYNVPPEVAPHMVEWTRRFMEHARANDWPNIIITPFDEPAKWHQYTSDMGMLHFIKPQFKQQVALLRQGDPQARIYGSIHHYYGGIEFLEDVDIFCTNAVHENWGLPDEVRAGGKTLWQYSFTSDRTMPSVPRYTYGFYFAGHDSRGSLTWAYNWGDDFDTIDGYNWMYVFTTPFEVLPMPFAEGLREAWDDRRLIETIKRRAAEKGVDLSGFWARFFEDVAASRGVGGSSTLNDFWEQAREARKMDQWRDQLVAKLISLR